MCERHGLSLRTFRWRARKGGLAPRRPARPLLAPDPDPPPSPPGQNDPLVIPEAPEAPSGTPLTTSQMVDTCWSHVQAAVAAGQLIQARGWLRLYKELKPLVPYAEIEAREAAESAAGEEDVARPLHCFSDPEPRTPEPEPPSPSAPAPDPAADLVRLTTRLAAVARQAESAALRGDVAPLLHCFSGAQSGARCDPDDDPARLVAELNALTAKAERTLADQALALQLHCFSDAEGDEPGPGP